MTKRLSEAGVDRQKHLPLQMMMTTERIKRLVKVGPFLILAGDGLAFIASYFKWYPDFQWFHSQILGHGALGVIVWIFYAHMHRYCMYSVISLYTLLILNILNIAYFFLPLVYYQAYAGIIIFGGLTLSVLYLLKKWRNQALF